VMAVFYIPNSWGEGVMVYIAHKHRVIGETSNLRVSCNLLILPNNVCENFNPTRGEGMLKAQTRTQTWQFGPTLGSQ
jgi:hypothetical protein